MGDDARPTRPRRLRGEALAARDAKWRWAQLNGATIAEIARRWRVNVRTVERRLAKVREAEANAYPPRDDPFWADLMVPLFPIGAFTPNSACAHRGRIKAGSYFYCPCNGCHQSGMDHHPALKRS